MEELIQLDKQLLLWFNGSDSLFLDGLVETLTTATTWIPLYLGLFYLVLKNNDNVQKVLLVLGCAGLCVFLAGSLNDLFVKPWVARWRPSRDPEIAMLVDVVNGYRGGRYGFFSSHAANTFSLAIFFTLLVRSKVLSVAMILWSLLNCWTRLYLGVHFPGDILCGLLWGGVVGTGMWFLHQHIYKKINTQDFYVSTQYTATGYQKSDVDIVICILLLTIVYAILKSCYTLYI
ncbi:phosphatase PAP2 family protein [Prevotella communis]|jgi:undecaprenyl-diphosphatase|uniref:Undecaprenyl-diphosphatase n=1 Tax=Prevotella communis TaxID=2913614 RepID=A0A1H0JRY9_9BACT|nr:phosphatase PAP2 family protein [Prevotella communis]UKK57997.1 phosphatase PAP2 family protein [Prevotella communis]UKK60665.1 phosphatase PAP2 family protein [Prevotella communis]UKK68661.1 phosphatase PAP2 family protein [Prevotella communis]UKK69204.1 phosphatase PAP2 family protein [Prevotella communis]SDO46299.1 undecaprenyl-diphosphatase [Prevotella communis]